ncbi:hypothetical protein CSC81_09870 [Tenacibaculum discolor]|uniref:HEPN domain-containing protein n=1 Tax=Tenacibaculum discolor TaxID=361581 RepID=A0A2G1BTK4_9FLAO|nr:hypothetical protein [Tenacibaculum discolor]MDP2541613.1 hypothetical protein [Tenacibaculum discolor]PHN97377.1 hypothetical protein CSC81_09870 [Tenacibaculum discolor]
MGNFNEHINHSIDNLNFLSKVNETINDRWDWQVTICFYTALHLINAHIVDKTGRNYLSHSQVEDAINPYATLSVSKLDEDTYKSYKKLFQLSRRSRYLLNENFNKGGIVDIQRACLTYDKHFRKSIYHLDIIMNYMSSNYNVNFSKCEIDCIELKNVTLTNFTT